MRQPNLSQPAGGPYLQKMLEYAQHTLQDTVYAGLYYYKMGMGYVDELVVGEKDGVNRTGLHKPSYNLVVYHNRTPIYAAYYELDKRFSLELSEGEAERIEDYLANETIGIFTVRGIMFFMIHRYDNKVLFSITRKESDDKKFMSLN